MLGFDDIFYYYIKVSRFNNRLSICQWWSTKLGHNSHSVHQPTQGGQQFSQGFGGAGVFARLRALLTDLNVFSRRGFSGEEDQRDI